MVSYLAALFRGLFCCSSSSSAGGAAAAAAGSTVITRPGLFEAEPDVNMSLVAPGPSAVAAMTGPDQGVTSLKPLQQQQQQASKGTSALSWQPQYEQQHIQQQQQQQQPPEQQATAQQQQQPAWGHAVSLYDTDPLTGLRNGDPIADCYGVITYPQGAVLALADGVNWGERAKLAGRAAVLGFCSHIHQQLAAQQGSRRLSSSEAFSIIRAAVLSAQQHVLAADGTLTTLVGALVARKRWGGGHVLMAVAIGDSPCYVWRAATGTVEEVTYLPPLHGFHRDPRVCPGCLGYAVGDQPDLTNITYSSTHLQPGDLVLLASDGISDNFDPVMRKLALASTGLPGKSPRASAAAAAAARASLAGNDDSSHGQAFYELAPMSPGTCHARALSDMAQVLRVACSQQPVQQQGTLQLGSISAGSHSNQHSQLPLQQQQHGGGLVIPRPGATNDTHDLSLVSTGASSAGNSSRKQQPSLGSPSSPAACELPPFANGASLTAYAAVHALLGFAAAATSAQRKVLEDPERTTSRAQQELTELLAGLPGKLDHASAVAYKVSRTSSSTRS